MSDFTDVKVFPLKQRAGNLLANGNATVGVVQFKFTVLEGSKGIFASLPARKGKKPGEDGNIPWYPEVKILGEEPYAEFQKAVREAYTKAMGGQVKAGEENQGTELVDGIPF